ncbi:MAG: GNAT family N-acetyltransferase [Anaerolineae bacterium]|nr:GNAT family N-acetyltransferase [Gloeobacterales cyanobacterium ES-bin-313]
MTEMHFSLVRSEAERAAYFALRHAIFVEEQQLFTHSDHDAQDATAYSIIASLQNQVIGVVRIYETEPGLWYGGRLGVHPDYRRVWQVGRGLIYKAVTTAHSWGCHRFLATVQLQNVRFFKRQHWDSLEELMICNQPHHLMEADLNYYPPVEEPRIALREAS